MFLLLGGAGVGLFSSTTSCRTIAEIHLPNFKRHRRYLISDSIEGWEDAVKVLIKSYFMVVHTLHLTFQIFVQKVES